MKVVELGEVAGKTGLIIDGDWVESKDQDPNGDVRLIQLSDIGIGSFLDKSARFLTSYTAKRLKCTYLAKGDILVARMPDPIGRACIFPGTDRPSVTVVDVCIVRPDPQIADVNYLNWAINSNDFQHGIDRYIKGSTRQRISRKNLELVPITLPPLDEQKRIAAILDQADKLRRLRQRAIDRLNELGQAIFYEMFGDLDDEESWERLGDHTTKIGSGATPKGGDASYKTQGIPLVRSMNVRDGVFDPSGLAFIDDDQAQKLETVILYEHDVLLNITGASVARSCIAPQEVSGGRVNQHVSIIRPKETIKPEFLQAFLMFPRTKRKLLAIAESGATRQAITKAQIDDLLVPVPCPKDQENFVLRKHEVINIQKMNAQHFTRSESLFASLQYRAFRGEL